MMSLKEFKEKSRFAVIESQGQAKIFIGSILPYLVDGEALNKLKGGACEDAYTWCKSNYTTSSCALKISCPNGYSHDGTSCKEGYVGKEGCGWGA